jgi:hypothetical protein
MRFVLLFRAESEPEEPPSVEDLAVLARYRAALDHAGVLVTSGWLQPTSTGAVVDFSGPDRTIIDGPFEDLDSYVAGFWVLRCATFDEALNWAQQAPLASGRIEVRQVEGED